MSDQPAKRFRIGNVQATIWENGNGDRTFYNVTFVRSYKDDGEWKESNSYGHAELLNLAKVSARCEAWIAEQ